MGYELIWFLAFSLSSVLQHKTAAVARVRFSYSEECSRWKQLETMRILMDAGISFALGGFYGANSSILVRNVLCYHLPSIAREDSTDPD